MLIRRMLNWMIWIVTGALMVTVLPNLPSVAQLPAAVHLAQVTPTNEQTEQISRLVVNDLMREGVRAEASVRSLTVVGHFALAHWILGEAGGQTLLRYENSEWRILERGGGAMDVATLRRLGVPDDATAQLLLEDVGESP